jgi:hypothetical protein
MRDPHEASDAILNVGMDALRFVLRDPAMAFATCVVEIGRVMSSVMAERKGIEFKEKGKNGRSL